jgi:hypothetical protein
LKPMNNTCPRSLLFRQDFAWTESPCTPQAWQSGSLCLSWWAPRPSRPEGWHPTGATTMYLPLLMGYVMWSNTTFIKGEGALTSTVWTSWVIGFNNYILSTSKSKI